MMISLSSVSSTRSMRLTSSSRPEENRLKFEVNGVEKTFALPACIAQGFLIPDDPAVIAAFQRRQELEEKLKSLQKNGLPK